jgi:hypothetical protein
MTSGRFPSYAPEMREMQQKPNTNAEKLNELIAEYRDLTRHLHAMNQIGHDDRLVVEAQLRLLRWEIEDAGGKVPHQLQGHSLMEHSDG